MTHPQMEEAVAELEAEQLGIEEILRSLSPEQWSAPTPAEPWDVRDQVTHLADFDEVAIDTATGGPRQINDEAVRIGFDEYTEWARRKGLEKSPAEMLDWYADNGARLRAMFRAKPDPKERVPWGLGMSVRTLVTARLMEHWAHGLDIRAALGIAPNASPRLRSVAFLVYSAMAYAFQVAKVTPPPGRTLRVELSYEGSTWEFGPADADDLITGEALEYCMVGVQRLRHTEAATLVAKGPLAEMALEHARAYL
jgi:uncharacterized protein (TIGR03084 family)